MIVDLVIIVFILIFAFIGFKKGLMSMLLTFLGSLLALVIALLIARPVAEALSSTVVGQWITDITLKMFNGIGGIFEIVIPSEASLKEQLINFPAFLVSGILETFKSINASGSDITLSQIVTPPVASIFLQILAFAISFLVLRILFSILKGLLKFITEIPVLKQINSLFGFLLGVLQGILILFVIFAIINLFSFGDFSKDFIQLINDSKIGNYFLNNNLLVIFFSSGFDFSAIIEKLPFIKTEKVLIESIL